MDAINQQGQHVLIYGERGVGKTSLANVLSGFLKTMGQKGPDRPTHQL
jgi:Holliday junction resolvasome RuvABC ATP-dependent DNA helicase subunit